MSFLLNPYAHGGSIVTDGLVFYLDATNPNSNTGTETTWYDLSPTGLNASGSSTISTTMGLARNQPYTTASTSILNDDTHSLFFWLQINGTTGSWDKIFGYEPSGTDRSPGIWRYPTARKIHWRFDPGNTDADFSATASTTYQSAGTEFVPDTWYYVGVTKNGQTASTYVNGLKLADRSVVATKTSGNSTIRLFPAYNGSTAYMAGVQIYNRPILTTEVFFNFEALKNKFGY